MTMVGFEKADRYSSIQCYIVVLINCNNSILVEFRGNFTKEGFKPGLCLYEQCIMTKLTVLFIVLQVYNMTLVPGNETVRTDDRPCQIEHHRNLNQRS